MRLLCNAIYLSYIGCLIILQSVFISGLLLLLLLLHWPARSLQPVTSPVMWLFSITITRVITIITRWHLRITPYIRNLSFIHRVKLPAARVGTARRCALQITHTSKSRGYMITPKIAFGGLSVSTIAFSSHPMHQLWIHQLFFTSCDISNNLCEHLRTEQRF